MRREAEGTVAEGDMIWRENTQSHSRINESQFENFNNSANSNLNVLHFGQNSESILNEGTLDQYGKTRIKEFQTMKSLKITTELFRLKLSNKFSSKHVSSFNTPMSKKYPSIYGSDNRMISN